MNKLLAAVLIGFLALNLAPVFSYAGEIDVLVRKLVEKGILTSDEAKEIVSETKEEAKKGVAQQAVEAKSPALPEWAQNTKLKGDFRLRYQYDHAKRLSTTTGVNDQHRARMRLRLGLDSKVNDKISVGVGLATGLNTNTAVNLTNKDTSRSPNQTLGEGFGKKPISLNYAYAKYSPFSWASLIGGKFNNPLWEPLDLIWDTDINPEGGAVTFTKKLTAKTDAFATMGVFVIDESASAGADPTMFVVQPGISQQLTDSVSLKGAVSYYGVSGVKHKQLDGTVFTNTNNTGKLAVNFKNIVPAVELGIKNPLEKLSIGIPYFALFGEYVKNIDSSAKGDDSGFMLGAKLGAEKIEKWQDWRFTYDYAMLGKDAVLDILPDSDRYGGKTGVRAHELIFDFGLGKNTWLTLDCYNSWQLPGNFGQTQTKPASVVQVDWNMKW